MLHLSGSCCCKRNSLTITEISVLNFCLNQLKCSSKTIQASVVSDVQLTSKQTKSDGSSLNHLTWCSQEHLGRSKSRNKCLGAGQQLSGSGSTSLYQLKCLWNDDSTNWRYQNRGKKTSFLLEDGYFLLRQKNTRERVGEGVNQSQEECKSY